MISRLFGFEIQLELELFYVIRETMLNGVRRGGADSQFWSNQNSCFVERPALLDFPEVFRSYYLY